jgi:hypothetical protein
LVRTFQYISSPYFQIVSVSASESQLGFISYNPELLPLLFEYSVPVTMAIDNNAGPLSMKELQLLPSSRLSIWAKASSGIIHQSSS